MSTQRTSGEGPAEVSPKPETRRQESEALVAAEKKHHKYSRAYGPDAEWVSMAEACAVENELLARVSALEAENTRLQGRIKQLEKAFVELEGRS